MSDLIKQIRAALACGTPLIGVATPDQRATVRQIVDGINGKESPRVQWDFVNGFTAALVNAASTEAVSQLPDPCQGNPFGAIVAALKLPARTVCFIHLANRWIAEPGVIQAIANLRDEYKATHRAMIFLGPSLDLVAELQSDVVMFDSPLPDREQLGKIVDSIHVAAGMEMDDASREKAVDAIQGLPAFAAEQVTAMCMRKSGCDLDRLWERKRQQIEQTPGLRVFRGGESFDDIGGCDVVKGFLRRIMDGKAKPRAVVFIDEIEKSLGGAKGDSSGVTQDQLGSLLTYMQDYKAAGMILVGPPGAAKSAVAKAAGNYAGIPTIQMDLGAAKGSLVGQSEQQMRVALKVVTAVSSGQSLWIATCNSISELPPELRRRFTLGTFFFDLPSAAERTAIWKIYATKYGFGDTLPADEGWTGAEIKQCYDIAWRLDCTLQDAAQFVVPVSRSASESIERLRTLADGRFLDASRPGVYRRETAVPAPVTDKARKIQLED